jgi:hypothetical protein
MRRKVKPMQIQYNKFNIEVNNWKHRGIRKQDQIREIKDKWRRRKKRVGTSLSSYFCAAFTQPTISICLRPRDNHHRGAPSGGRGKHCLEDSRHIWREFCGSWTAVGKSQREECTQKATAEESEDSETTRLSCSRYIPNPTHASTQSHSNACQHTITQQRMPAHNHTTTHASTQSHTNACQHTITQQRMPAHNHTPTHASTQSHNNACQHTITHQRMPAHNHTPTHARTQSHSNACQNTVTHQRMQAHNHTATHASTQSHTNACHHTIIATHARTQSHSIA